MWIKRDIRDKACYPYPLNMRSVERICEMPLTREEEILAAAGREFLDPLYYRHTGGGAVFGNSLDIDWITKDGVIVATGTNWPAEIQIYVPWGKQAVLEGAVA